ncbi:MAG: MBL fold metallo-hydrolase [Burkholderiales bacterium]|nr:MBL fold metallo-hydrolase [Burkholderiales bacterium]
MSQAKQSAALPYHNAPKANQGGLGKALRIIFRMLFQKPANSRPGGDIPVQALTREALQAAPNQSVFRLGHSTVLLKLNGDFWLTDPVFSERASPVQWAGPKRFHQPPIGIAELPPIKGVILSHDHYDHLDHGAILQLAGKVEYFLTPKGVGDILISWGVAGEKVRQLDWWEETEVAGIQFAATPSQHFSGRGLFDGNRTLWASWVIMTDTARIFFSGDSGYFAGFRRIGEQYGPFDLTLMETGAYDENWPGVHMQPEETLQAHIDLRGQRLLPIHNGTFDLAFHAWQDPFERIAALAAAAKVPLVTPRMGEAVAIQDDQYHPHWWHDVAERREWRDAICTTQTA